MKFLTVFAALVAVACAGRTWDLQQLSRAIDNQHTDPNLKLHLIDALDSMVENLMAGNQVETVVVQVPATVSPMSLHELDAIITSPTADATLLPYYEAAQDQIMDALISGATAEMAIAPVQIPALEIHHYTLYELSKALQDPETDPMLIPYFERALNTMMDTIATGQNMEFIVIAVLTPGVAPGAADDDASAPNPVPQPPTAPQPTSPLVQIIVNVKQQ